MKPTIEAAAPLHIVDIVPVTNVEFCVLDACRVFSVPPEIVTRLEVLGYDLVFSDGRIVRHTGMYTMDEDTWRMVVDWLNKKIKADTAAMIERGEVWDVTGGVE